MHHVFEKRTVLQAGDIFLELLKHGTLLHCSTRLTASLHHTASMLYTPQHTHHGVRVQHTC